MLHVWEHTCLLLLGVRMWLAEEVLGSWHHRLLLLDSILRLRDWLLLHAQTTQGLNIVGIGIILVKTWCCRFHVAIEVREHHLSILNQGIIRIGHLRRAPQSVIISIGSYLLLLDSNLWRSSQRRIRGVALNIPKVLFLLMILMCAWVINLVGETNLMLDIHLFLSFEFNARLALLHGGLNVIHISLIVLFDANATRIERELMLLL